MDTKNKHMEDTQNINFKIQNKKRGEILYYSIDQVADLLNENINNIRYYTNIFDDLLKIEIIDKDLRYSNNDVDKLDFLITLKNKGMSLKEIKSYYNKLPLESTEIEPYESNLLSVKELIDSIKEEQQIQFDNFKVQLIADIKNANSLYLQDLSSAIIKTQNKVLDEFKQDLSKKIEEYIGSKFDNVNKNLHNKVLDGTTKYISEKIDSKSNELKVNLQNNFNALTKASAADSELLIKEVKDFKKVIMNAYSVQYQVEMDSANTSFWNKLLKRFSYKQNWIPLQFNINNP